jgi:hypothetical protein
MIPQPTIDTFLNWVHACYGAVTREQCAQLLQDPSSSDLGPMALLKKAQSILVLKNFDSDVIFDALPCGGDFAGDVEHMDNNLHLNNAVVSESRSNV